MSYPLFSKEWAEAFQQKVNNSQPYRVAASGWEGPVLFRVEPDGPSLWLNLWHGTCKEARPATEDDAGRAAYIISAPVETWRKLHAGELEPIVGLMQGKLSLDKGSLVSLARYSKAAKVLINTASEIPTEFPGATGEKPSLPDQQRKPAAPTSRPSTGNGAPLNRPLKQDSFPLQLYQKAKKLGVWNPADIDFSADRRDWESFEELEQEVTLHLISLFLAGEESVTEELLPLMLVMAREHRMEEEIYLTTFLFEEAKHTEFFHRFIDHVIPERPDLTRFHSEPYKKLFYEELPGSMQRLLTDPSSQAQAEASVTYNMIVEGVLAETGYHAFYTMLERNDLMPGLRKGVELVKRDESRHIAYGLYLLNRLVQHNPKLWPLIETRMEELLDLSLQIINDIFDRYEVMPFGLTRDEFVEYALGQFRKRMRKLESGETLQADDDV